MPAFSVPRYVEGASKEGLGLPPVEEQDSADAPCSSQDVNDVVKCFSVVDVS